MRSFKYQLEKYKGMKTRHTCPSCEGKKTFALYVDETGNHLDGNVGKCDRENNCGYHRTPKQYFADNGIVPEFNTSTKTFEPIKETSFIDANVFKRSLNCYHTNKFIVYLNSLFDAVTVHASIKKYFIGTCNHWPGPGATVFWQIDKAGKIRTGKVMLYNPETGRRVKDPITDKKYIYWAHKALKLHDFNLRQCFFGEHLIQGSSKPIAIVESEKTAVIASVYLPQFTWLACGSLQNLTAHRCRILTGRKVILYPDLKAFDRWNEVARELKFEISDLLERSATSEERQQGLDIADYLTQYKLS